MAHCLIPQAERFLDTVQPVEGKGTVRLIDYLGGDRRLVEAARLCLGSHETAPRTDEELIETLVADGPDAPLRQVVFTFELGIPLFLLAPLRECCESSCCGPHLGRAMIADAFYTPAQASFPPPADTPTASAVSTESWNKAIGMLTEDQRRSLAHCRKMDKEGIPFALLYADLHPSTYTRIHWQVTLRELVGFLRTVLGSDRSLPQLRGYAEAVMRAALQVCPIAVDAFLRHALPRYRPSPALPEHADKPSPAGAPPPQPLEGETEAKPPLPAKKAGPRRRRRRGGKSAAANP